MFSQASSGGGVDGFGASPLQVNGTIRTNVLWGADTGSSKLMVWTGASGDTGVSLCTEIDVGGSIQATVSLPLEGGGLAIGVLLKPTGEREAVIHFYEAPLAASDACSSGSDSTPIAPQRRATWKVMWITHPNVDLTTVPEVNRGPFVVGSPSPNPYPTLTLTPR